MYKKHGKSRVNKKLMLKVGKQPIDEIEQTNQMGIANIFIKLNSIKITLYMYIVFKCSTN